MKVLVVNAGSSSLKYQLFDTAEGIVLAKGNCERIGIEGSLITHKTMDGKSRKKEIPIPTHSDAISLVVEMLLDKEVGCIESAKEIEAIGHRVVHGGPFFAQSVLVTDEVMEVLENCRAYAPLHTGAHIMRLCPAFRRCSYSIPPSIRRWRRKRICTVFRTICTMRTRSAATARTVRRTDT